MGNKQQYFFSPENFSFQKIRENGPWGRGWNNKILLTQQYSMCLLLEILLFPNSENVYNLDFLGEIKFYVRVGIQVFSRLKEGARFRGCSL